MKKYHYCIGLMSGTSLDGIDLVYVKIARENYKNYEILACQTVAYSNSWRTRLQEAIGKSSAEHAELTTAYGVLLGEVINEFMKAHGISRVDFIASHGHTVLHQPEVGVTLQIGDGQVIANTTGQKVVCDFRTQDVALGGQGAPLVPIGDQLLFDDYTHCMNLGGFANISYEENGKRIACDIGPVNIVLNKFTRQLNLEYDDKGTLARTGTLDVELFERLNSLEYYQWQPPKSLGLEWVLAEVFPILTERPVPIPSILHTVVEHAAFQIGSCLGTGAICLVTGGGTFNTYLMERIEFYAKGRVVKGEDALINYKEALIFALLGLLRMEGQVNCLAAVTGAVKDHSSGEIFEPQGGTQAAFTEC